MTAGRPRLAGERWPSGRLRPDRASITAAHLQRLRAVSNDPLLGSQIGRLLFLGLLSQQEADAAWKVAEIYGRWHRAMGIKPAAVSPAYQRGYGIGKAGDSDDDLRRHRRAVRRFDDLIAEIDAMETGRMHRLRLALERLCVHDAAPEPGAMRQVKQALGALARTMGLARR